MADIDLFVSNVLIEALLVDQWLGDTEPSPKPKPKPKPNPHPNRTLTLTLTRTLSLSLALTLTLTLSRTLRLTLSLSLTLTLTLTLTRRVVQDAQGNVANLRLPGLELGPQDTADARQGPTQGRLRVSRDVQHAPLVR